MALDELPGTPATAHEIRSARAADVLVVRLLAPFESLGQRDQVDAVLLRESSKIEVTLRWHMGPGLPVIPMT
jgi:hypothetical protein